MVNVDWKQHKAAIWRKHTKKLRAVSETDPIELVDLLGIEQQKQQLLNNTEQFLNNQAANHALLWGSRGTGKSSLVKAIFNKYKANDLRLLEINKDDLSYFPEIVDLIRSEPYKYIVYCDDLSFESQENQYKHLKSVLEGSIELPPKNVLIYATSNRRHLLPEYMQDNINTTSVEGEVHFSDTVEEKTSLADRFGLWLSFYPPTMADYLKMIDYYLPDVKDKENLHVAAKRFSISRGSKSGRTAKQFSINYMQQQ